MDESRCIAIAWQTQEILAKARKDTRKINKDRVLEKLEDAIDGDDDGNFSKVFMHSR